MIRICHLVDELNMGGLENILKNLILAIDKEKYLPEVWCLKRKGILAGEIEREGILIRDFGLEGGIGIRHLLGLAKELRKENFKVIHSYGMFPMIWAVACGILAKIPVRINHCGNLYYDVAIKDKIKLRFFSFFTTKIVAVSEAVKKSIIESIGIDADKIVVIYSSARSIETQTPPERREMRRQLGIGEDNFVIGSIGRLVEHKGHKYLIEAMNKLRPSASGLKCLIVGDGPAAENLKARARDLNLEDTIIFTGLRRDIEKLLPAMDVFVQPSTLLEGLPVVLAEAASSGLPLIATDIGGSAELVHDGLNGFVIPPANSEVITEKIRFLTESTDKRKRMGAESRKIWAQRFTLEEMVNKIERLYEHAS